MENAKDFFRLKVPKGIWGLDNYFTKWEGTLQEFFDRSDIPAEVLVNFAMISCLLTNKQQHEFNFEVLKRAVKAGPSSASTFLIRLIAQYEEQGEISENQRNSILSYNNNQDSYLDRLKSKRLMFLAYYIFGNNYTSENRRQIYAKVVDFYIYGGNLETEMHEQLNYIKKILAS